MAFLDFFDRTLEILAKYGNLFLEGTLHTLYLSLAAVLVGTLLGALLALARALRPLRWLAACYVEVIRGTPMLLQLYFFYFLLPMALPFAMSEYACILLALCVSASAYISEIIRAGIQAVDRGQMEAARSLGLSSAQAMVHVVLPQAVKNILPALGSEFVAVIKETSLASTFFIGDLMTQYKTISAAIYRNLEPLVIVGMIYFFLSFTLSRGIAALERRLRAHG